MEYHGTTAIMDCWGTATENTVKYLDGGARVIDDGTASWNYLLSQSVKDFAPLRGRTVTFSVKIREITGRALLQMCDGVNRLSSEVFTAPGTYHVTAVISAEATQLLCILVHGLNEAIDVTADWMKLELGSCPTPFKAPVYSDEVLRIKALSGNGFNAETLGNRPPEDFANAYNLNIGEYLSGKSGDIRALAYLLPTGGLNINTYAVPDVTFPLMGDLLLVWSKSMYTGNDLMYGTLMVRPMAEDGDTYICSVFNGNRYTSWQKLSDGGAANEVRTLTLIGTAENCTFGSILDWANSTANNSLACTISAYGMPSDAPTQNEALLTLVVDTTGARKYVEWRVYAGDQHKFMRRCIYGATWNGDWFNIADGGSAASVGTYTEEKIAALEARIAALESKS